MVFFKRKRTQKKKRFESYLVFFGGGPNFRILVTIKVEVLKIERTFFFLFAENNGPKSPPML
jgi:hypothetical protein